MGFFSSNKRKTTLAGRVKKLAARVAKKEKIANLKALEARYKKKLGSF
jgi:hypothetical protein